MVEMELDATILLVIIIKFQEAFHNDKLTEASNKVKNIQKKDHHQSEDLLSI